MAEKYYLTTALHYVNGEPHIGHAYETILGDVLCRYLRLFGFDVKFLTGIDEHGQKIAEAAAKSGRTPQEHCDMMAERWQAVWEKLSIKPDVFFRTTNPEHKAFVANILNDLNDRGDIYAAEYSGWYCTPDERFWTEKDIIAGNCPLCGRPVEHLTEKNYFFKMKKYKKWLVGWIASNPNFIKPETRRNEVLGFLKKDLGDLCISRPRARLAWGIPLPFDPDYVTYVWFDALLNYLSATHIHSVEGFQPEHWPANLHLIGKDIVTTHAVYWPIMLHAAGYEPPRTIFAHGWWMIGETKMGKSVGNAVNPLDLAEKYGADAFRYVLMREMTPGQDANFSEEAFIKRYNSDLANDLGNLYSRIAKVITQARSTGKEGIQPVEDPNPELWNKLDSLAVIVRDEVLNFRPNGAIEAISTIVRGLNQYIEVLRPWEETDKKISYVIRALNAVDRIAELLEPVMPGKMGNLRSAIVDSKPVTLFPRIDVKSRPAVQTPHSSPSRSAGKQKPASNSAEEKVLVSIEDFAKLDLRVGRVLEARRLEGSDKLLVLQVQVGDSTRQIVAGIAQSFTPEEMAGKSIIVVANLIPAKLRGELSEGMLLAASDGNCHFLVTTDPAVPTGSKVK